MNVLDLSHLPPHLDAGTVQLRPFTATDGVTVRAALDDDLMRRWWNLSLPDDDAAVAWAGEVREDRVRWAVVAGDELLGSVHLNHLDTVNASCELGWWLLSGGRGRGAATAAARTVVGAARDLGVARVVAFHAVENDASCRVADRAGLDWEATHRLSHRYPDGRLHDEHCHVALFPEDERTTLGSTTDQP